MTPEKKALVLRFLVPVAVAGLLLFVLASLLTNSAFDPPRGHPQVISNVGGTVGAYLSHGLLAFAGVGNYLIIALITVLGGTWLMRKELPPRVIVISAVATALLFLTPALWSFDAASDPHRGYRAAAATHNACGWLGAEVGYFILAYIGWGAWPMLLAGFALLAAYIAKYEIKDKWLRLAGALLVVLFCAGIGTVAYEGTTFSFDKSRYLIESPGGLLGQAIAGGFGAAVGSLGTYLVLAAMAVVGLILATDSLVLVAPIGLWKWMHERRQSRLAMLGGATKKVRAAKAADGEEKSEEKADAKVAVVTEAVSAAEVAKARPVPKIRSGGRDAETGELIKPQEEAQPAAAKRKAAEAEVKPATAEKEVKTEKAAAEKITPAGEEKPKEKGVPAIRVPREKKPVAAVQTERQEPSGRLVDSSECPVDQAPAYPFPSLDLLDPPEPFDISKEEEKIRENSANLEATLKEFGVEAQVVGIDTGPVITQYEVSLAAGIKVGKVIGLSDDLAIGLKTSSVRIVAPLPGRGTIGIEVPNLHRKTVRLRESIEDGLPVSKRHNLPLFLGKDSAGNPLVRDLSTMPHLLIGGTTGSGKSVCLNSIIMSILYARSPRDVKFILVDPKMVEMTMFAAIPHLMCPVVSDMARVQSILEWLIGKMEERYGLLAEAGVKNIVGFNNLSREKIVERFKPATPEDEMRLTYHMPYIVLIVDELADLMMTCSKEAEAAITRLAQKSRAVGIHLILATQRPSVDVVTGLIKSNHPCRVAFQVASGVDSRTIIDGKGAEKLLGKGDMLLMQPGASKLLRAQCTFVSDEEVNKVVEFVAKNAPREFNRELVQIKPKAPTPKRGSGGGSNSGSGGDDYDGGDGADFAQRDDLYYDAVRYVLQYQRGSVSLLQRKLNIGYGRASRLIDFMAEDHVVGEYSGSQAREVLMTLDEWESRRGQGVGGYKDSVGDEEEPEIQDDELVENEK